jgi:defect in organelle trafficking protein DotD
MSKKFFIILPLILLLAGCSSDDNKKIVDLNLSYIPTSRTPAPVNTRYEQVQLASAAKSVDGSMNKMASIEMAVYPKAQLAKPFDPKTTGMTQVVSVNWYGPMSQIINKIALATHYKVRTLGAEPAIVPLVSINMQNQPMAYILRNVQYQVDRQALIKVYPKTHIIEVRYIYNR